MNSYLSWIHAVVYPTQHPMARFIALLLALFGVWMGTSAAHELRGWRTFLLPVIYLSTFVLGIFFLLAAIQGTALTLENLLIDFGLAN